MRQFIPLSWRRLYQLFRRYIREHYRQQRVFSHTKTIIYQDTDASTLSRISTQQQIKPSSYFENKTHNIDLCIQALNGLIIRPHETCSFWHLVKSPTRKHGYKIGRNLVNGVVSEDIGGGICQVSCLIYINALKSNFTILERHAHSLDIYQEHERFTPLGSDATVVYGYKDLQIQNPYPFDVQLVLTRTHDQIKCSFLSAEPIPEQSLEFSIHIEKNHKNETIKRVDTCANDRIVAQSRYQLPITHQAITKSTTPLI